MGQCLLETAAYLSILAGRRVSVAMTVDRLEEEIKSDVSYKYIRQVVDGSVDIGKSEGKLSIYNYHRYNLTVVPDGLIMFKGSRFLVPDTLTRSVKSSAYGTCWCRIHDCQDKGSILVAWAKTGN